MEVLECVNCTVEEMFSWLEDRVADENDIVVDEMQEDFGQLLADRDEAKADADNIGTKEYWDNMRFLEKINSPQTRGYFK